MMKFGFSLQDRYSLPMEQVLDLLAEAGFSAVSVSWKQDNNLREVVRLARERGLAVQSVHGPIRTLPALWNPNIEVARPALQDFLDGATFCAENNIPILVVHTWYGKEYTFCEESLYFGHFETLVAHAEALGVSIAFEHLEGPEYCAALMDHFQGHPTAGFCWDSGHECCYNPGWEFLNRYGDRLTMTHLNDNLGLTSPDGRLISTDDLHLFPGDGVIDWKDALQKLKASRKQEILNLELKIRPHGDRCALDLYSQIPLEQYFQKAYDNACRVLGAYFEDQA